MSSRGRGTRGTRKPSLLPNLSVAGKRETKAEASTAKVSSRERRDRVRGGRGSRSGRGHGEREPRKPVYIEQTGIFSSGLNDDGRHDRPRVRDEISSIGLIRQKKAAKDIEMVEDLDYKPITYETEWLSDEEGDVRELAELLKDEFIADLKEGDVKPLVLPLSDEMQFNKSSDDIIKKEACEIDTPSSSTKNTSIDKKPPVNKATRKEEKLDVRDRFINPTSASSEEASKLLKTISSSKDSSLMLWQLPSTLSVLASGSMASDLSLDQKSKEVKSEVRHCLEDIPSGTELGVLRIRKSGKTELNIDGMLPLDITCAVPGQHQESVVMIQLSSQKNEVFGRMEGFKSEYPGKKSDDNEIYMLGNLSSSLVCSHDFPQSIGMRRKIGAREKPENKGINIGDNSLKSLMDELRRLEKLEENWKSWTDYYSCTKRDDST